MLTPVTNDSQAGATLKAKPEKSEEKDSSGFASSQPNHIYFCCRHGIEHPSPLFLLHPSLYAREDWQWDGAAGGAVLEVSLIALKSREFRLLPFTPPSTARDAWPWTQHSVPRAKGHLSPTQPGLFCTLFLSPVMSSMCFYKDQAFILKRREKNVA